MKLLEEIRNPEIRWPNGVVKPLGRFLCEFCNTEVTRTLYAGIYRKSCGCNQTPRGEHNPKYRHGESYGRLYRIWAGMMRRCKAKRGRDAKLYRKRGIRVCKEWQIAANFIRWARANGYADNLTLDRENNFDGYHPGNCRWITPLESARNRRRSNAIRALKPHVIASLNSGCGVRETARLFGIFPATVRTIRKEFQAATQ